LSIKLIVCTHTCVHTVSFIDKRDLVTKLVLTLYMTSNVLYSSSLEIILTL
jgi:hypothetical protein